MLDKPSIWRICQKTERVIPMSSLLFKSSLSGYFIYFLDNKSTFIGCHDVIKYFKSETKLSNDPIYLHGIKGCLLFEHILKL